MTEIKCTSCKNYHPKEVFCTVDEEHMGLGHGMDVIEINRIWGITFQECKRYEENNEN